jgi:hypothetical protein
MHVSCGGLSGGASARARSSLAMIVASVLAALGAGLTVVPAAGAAGVTPALTPPVSVSALPTSKVEEVLSGVPLKDLSTTQLSEVLSRLPGFDALPVSSLRAALAKTIEGLEGKGDTLGQLLSSPELASGLEAQLKKLLSFSELTALELPLLLEGKTLSGVLGEVLGSAGARQVLGGLLSSSGEPKQLLEQVLAAVNPGKLQGLLGSTLSGEPVTTGTVEELAGQLGTNSEGLAKDLNTTSSQLPSKAMALTAPLTDGKAMGAFDALEGLDLGLLGSTHEKTPEGGGGGSGGSGSGGSGGSGSGGSGANGGAGGAGGSSGAPGGTTVVVSLPAQGGSSLGSTTSGALAKVRILSRKVKGDAVTLVLDVPAVGSVLVSGKGVRSVREQADRAERVTVRAVLTKAGVASLRKRHRRLEVKLEVSFTPISGSSSSAATTVAFG